MGLLITATETAKIKIKGTEIELPSVYARLEFAGHADGKTLEIAFKTYSNKEEFKSENATPIPTSIVNGAGGNIRFQLAENEVQSLEVAMAKLSEVLTGQGFEVAINI